MHRNLFLLLGLSAILATSSFAQNNTSQKRSGPNVAYRSSELEAGLERERIVGQSASRAKASGTVGSGTRVSAVKASIVINIVTVEKIAFEMINQKRRENGLQPLIWNAELAGAARTHSQNMAENQFFGHRGLDGSMVSDRADSAGLNKWRAIGENIAFNRGYEDPVAKAVEGWMNSPTHRHNLLDANWKESAIGVAVAPDGSYYFTQDFLLRK
jgi:uncharacterized protein YkwD